MKKSKLLPAETQAAESKDNTMNDAFQKAKERYKKMSKITISGFYDEISGRLSDQICVLHVLCVDGSQISFLPMR